MKTQGIFSLALVAVAGAVGCAASTPHELENARTAYDRASHGPAAQFAPADVHAAQETLAVAERSFDKDGDSQATKDIAYAAERKAEIAESHARTAMAMQQRDQALASGEALKEHQVRLTSAELAATKAQVQNQQQLMQNQQQQLQSTQQELQSERQRREDAEKRAQQAAADLARVASVKQDATRGMVITLQGGVLFASDKSDLLPMAQSKLSQVADVLTKQDKDSRIRVEGYTDSQGSVDYNQGLSQRRAESVRTYLVAHGIASDRITAEGFGPSKPVAENTSPEGRANNRRVEIVVEPAHGGPSSTSSP